MSNARRIVAWIVAGLLGVAGFPCAAQSLDSGDAYITGLAIASDGGILFGGQFSAVGGLPRAGLAKVHSDGRLDTSFNPALPTLSRVDALALQADGKVIVGGYFPDQKAAGGAYSLLRLNADGSADTLPVQPDGSPSALYVQSDGKILVGGGSFVNFGNQPRLHLARLNADLTLDPVFQPSVPPQSNVTSFAVQSNGSILISGNFQTIADPLNEIFAPSLARVDINGNVDAGFMSPIANDGGAVYQARVLASDKIIAGGYYSLTGIGTTTVSLLNSDGSLDSADFTPNTVGGPTALSLQSDGKILIGGVFDEIGTASNPVARNNIGRLNVNGFPDNQFIAATNAGPSGQVISMVEQADARIMIGGAFTSVDNQTRYCIARLLSNGAIDPTFNINDEIFVGNFDP